MKKEELKKIIQEKYGKEYFLGEHGSRGGKNVLGDILKDGISLRTKGNYYRNCAGTLMSNGRANFHLDDALAYSYGASPITYLCAFPVELESDTGKKVFCGYSEKTYCGLPKDQKDFDCLTTKICDLLGYIPSEFILAIKYLGKTESTYYLNEKHYSGMSIQEKQAFFLKISNKLNDIIISQLGNEYKDTRYYEAKKVLERLKEKPYSLEEAEINDKAFCGLQTELFEQRMMLQLKKYQEETHIETNPEEIKDVLKKNSIQGNLLKENETIVELHYGKMFEGISAAPNDEFIASAMKITDEKSRYFFRLTYNNKESTEMMNRYVNELTYRRYLMPYLVNENGEATIRNTGIIGGIGVDDGQRTISLIKDFLKMGCCVKIGERVLNSEWKENDEELIRAVTEILITNNRSNNENNGKNRNNNEVDIEHS